MNNYEVFVVCNQKQGVGISTIASMILPTIFLEDDVEYLFVPESNIFYTLKNIYQMSLFDIVRDAKKLVASIKTDKLKTFENEKLNCILELYDLALISLNVFDDIQHFKKIKNS